jgi:hypothetical protein
MRRFIDLRHTFEETGVNFAWWDTVTDCFEVHCGVGGFETWDDFVGWYKGGDIERYKGLCPEWVFEMKGSKDPC